MQPEQDQNYWEPSPEVPQPTQPQSPVAPLQESAPMPAPAVPSHPPGSSLPGPMQVADQSSLPPVAAPVPDMPPPAPQQSGSPTEISWQASEYVHHEKSGSWFLALVGVTALLILTDVFLMHSWTFGLLLVVMASTVVVFAQRPPRFITYSVTSGGIQINEKHFDFHDFRAFGVVQENAFYSIRLVPNKRFMPMVSVFFPPEQGEQIVDVFGSVLPMENIELDPIDKLVGKIRF